jgi:hypothetical protein
MAPVGAVVALEVEDGTGRWRSCGPARLQVWLAGSCVAGEGALLDRAASAADGCTELAEGDAPGLAAALGGTRPRVVVSELCVVEEGAAADCDGGSTRVDVVLGAAALRAFWPAAAQAAQVVRVRETEQAAAALNAAPPMAPRVDAGVTASPRCAALYAVQMGRERGNALARDGRFGPALTEYRAALRLLFRIQPAAAGEESKEGLAQAVLLPLLLNAAHCCLNVGRPLRCVEYCDRALAVEPASLKGLFRRAKGLLEAREWAKSAEAVRAFSDAAAASGDAQARSDAAVLRALLLQHRSKEERKEGRMAKAMFAP